MTARLISPKNLEVIKREDPILGGMVAGLVSGNYASAMMMVQDDFERMKLQTLKRHYERMGWEWDSEAEIKWGIK